jgi:hypothetical protein
MDPAPDGSENLLFGLEDLKRFSKNRAEVRATVIHHRAYDPRKPIRTEGSPDIFYGRLQLRYAANEWKVTGVKGGWEQPE